MVFIIILVRQKDSKTSKLTFTSNKQLFLRYFFRHLTHWSWVRWSSRLPPFSFTSLRQKDTQTISIKHGLFTFGIGLCSVKDYCSMPSTMDLWLWELHMLTSC